MDPDPQHCGTQPKPTGGEGCTVPGALGVGVVGDDGGVVAGCAGQLPAVPGLLLQVADDGALGHVADGHHVPDGQVGLLKGETFLF